MTIIIIHYCLHVRKRVIPVAKDIVYRGGSRISEKRLNCMPQNLATGNPRAKLKLVTAIMSLIVKIMILLIFI